jgi:hypothetical protein
MDRIHATAGRRRHRGVSILQLLSLKRVLTVIIILRPPDATSYEIIKCWPDSDALTELGLERYCCRRMVLTHVDLIEKLLKYNRESITSGWKPVHRPAISQRALKRQATSTERGYGYRTCGLIHEVAWRCALDRVSSHRIQESNNEHGFF